jgi:hypothetical protein
MFAKFRRLSLNYVKYKYPMSAAACNREARLL